MSNLTRNYTLEIKDIKCYKNQDYKDLKITLWGEWHTYAFIPLKDCETIAEASLNLTFQELHTSITEWLASAK